MGAKQLGLEEALLANLSELSCLPWSTPIAVMGHQHMRQTG